METHVYVYVYSSAITCTLQLAARPRGMDFSRCLAVCREARSSLGKLFSEVPDEFALSSDGKCLLFLAAPGGGKRGLYCVEEEEARSGWGPWRLLQAAQETRQLSKAEQLLRERMRVVSSGVTAFRYLEPQDAVFVQNGPACCVRDWRRCGPVTAQFPELLGSVDHQVCPGRSDVVACVRDGDIWLLCAGPQQHTHQLTHTADSRPATHMTAGQPSFIIQVHIHQGIHICGGVLTLAHCIL